MLTTVFLQAVATVINKLMCSIDQSATRYTTGGWAQCTCCKSLEKPRIHDLDHSYSNYCNLVGPDSKAGTLNFIKTLYRVLANSHRVQPSIDHAMSTLLIPSKLQKKKLLYTIDLLSHH